MWPGLQSNLKKHVVCEEWWIAESDLKVENLDDENLCVSISRSPTKCSKPINEAIPERGKMFTNNRCPQNKKTRSLKSDHTQNKIHSIKRQDHHRGELKSRQSRRTRKDKSDHSRNGVLMAIRHFINVSEKSAGGRDKGRKNRKQSGRDSKKKRKLEKVKKQMKRCGVILNHRVEQLMDVDDSSGVFTNNSCKALTTSSSKEDDRTCDSKPFNPGVQRGKSSIAGHRPFSGLTFHQPSKDGGSSLTLFDSTQFNNSSASLHHQGCNFRPTSNSLLTSPSVCGMKAYDFQETEDTCRHVRDFLEFERDSCYLDKFRLRNEGASTKYDPINDTSKFSKASCNCIHSNLVCSSFCKCCIGEGCCPNYTHSYQHRKDSVSDLVSRLLKSDDLKSCGTNRFISRECLRYAHPCPATNRHDCYRSKTPLSCSPAVQASLQSSRICVIPLKQCDFRKMKSRCCSCHNHGCSRHIIQKRETLPLMRMTCGKSHPMSGFECCSCNSFCGDRGGQLWQKPFYNRRNVFSRNMAKERPCFNECSKFRILTPCCSKCLQKMLNY